MQQSIKSLALGFVCLLGMNNITKAQGDLVWARSMGGPGTLSDFAYAIAVDAGGNVYTAGVMQDVADFDPGTGIYNLTSAGQDDIFICKLDASGNLAWAKRMGGPDYDEAFALTLDDAGNVYITGQFMDSVDFDPGSGVNMVYANGGYDMFVCKLTTDGDFVWAKNIGGLGTDVGLGIAVDDSGNVLTTGWVQQSTVDFDPGSATVNIPSYGFNDVFISKLDASGNYVWARRFGSIASDAGYAIVTDAAGNVYTAGTFTDDADLDPGPGGVVYPLVGNQDAFLTKLDAGGTFIWGKTIGSLDDIRILALTIDAAGNLYPSGYYDSYADMDPGSDTTIMFPSGMTDAWVSKLTNDGDLIWARDLGGSDYDHGWGVAVDNAGNVYTAGDYSTGMDVDPGPGLDSLIAVGGYDTYVSMLDSAGNFVWGKSLGGSGTDRPGGIAVDDSGNVYTAGVYLGTGDFDPGTGVFNMTPVGSGDVFVVKLSQGPLGINDVATNSISVYPNPAQNQITIQIPQGGNATADLLDVNGKFLQSISLTSTSTIVSVGDLPAGLYFLRVKTLKGVGVVKWVKD